MARKITISQITQAAGSTPGYITVAGDYTNIFLGKYYRNAAGTTQPFYSASTPPAGYTTIKATTFEIVESTKNNGKYTVYTATSAGDPSSAYSGGNTTIKINEALVDPTGSVTLGSITNISTYLLTVPNETSLVVPPTVLLTNRPISIAGRDTTSYGEDASQSLIKLASNFAGTIAPTNPYQGMTWFDTSVNLLKTYTGAAWTIANASALGITYRHVQASSSTTWTITHNLGLAAPFVAMITTFVDTGGGVPKIMFPSDVTFTSANALSVTFSAAQSGWALIRP